MRTLQIVVAIALLFCGVAQSRPTFDHYYGFTQLRQPNNSVLLENGKSHHTQDFHFFHPETKHYLQVKYSARLAAGIISLNEEHTVDKVSCREDGLTLHFMKQIDALEFALKYNRTSGLICGGHEWACEGTILRKQVGALTVQHNRVFIPTTPAKHNHFIEDGELTLNTNLLKPIELEDEAGLPDEAQTQIVHSRDISPRGVSNFLKNTYSEIKQLGSKVQASVDKVVRKVQQIASGNYDFNQTKSTGKQGFNFNGQNATKALELGEAVNCTNCYATFQLDVSVAFKIVGGQFVLFSLNTAAELDLMIGAILKPKLEKEFTSEISLGLGITFPTIPFSIGGVPFAINVDVPVVAGVSGTFTAGATIGAHVAIHGKAKFGLVADKIGGKPTTPTSDIEFSGKGGIDRIHGEVAAQAQVYILPTIVLVVDSIGGPHIGFKTYAEAIANFDTSGENCKRKGPAAQVSFSFGEQVAIGAALDIVVGTTRLYGPSKIEPKPVFNPKYSIYTGCFNITADKSTESTSRVCSPAVTPDPPAEEDRRITKLRQEGPTPNVDASAIVPGTVWFGGEKSNNDCSICNQTCNDSYVEVSVQYIGDFTDENGMVYSKLAMTTLSGEISEGVYCFVQTALSISFKGDEVFFTAFNDTDSYAECSDGFSDTISGVDLSFSTKIVNGNLNTLSSVDQCSTFILESYNSEAYESEPDYFDDSDFYDDEGISTGSEDSAYATTDGCLSGSSQLKFGNAFLIACIAAFMLAN